MPLSAADHRLLLDMRTAASEAQDLIIGMDSQTFINSTLHSAAVERELQIIGEAARLVSPDLMDRYSFVPWRQIIGLRNKLVHDYWEIRRERIWIVVSEHLQALVRDIDTIIFTER